MTTIAEMRTNLAALAAAASCSQRKDLIIWAIVVDTAFWGICIDYLPWLRVARLVVAITDEQQRRLCRGEEEREPTTFHF